MSLEKIFKERRVIMGAPFIFVIGAWVAIAPFMYVIQGIILVFHLIIGSFKKLFNIAPEETEASATDIIS